MICEIKVDSHILGFAGETVQSGSMVPVNFLDFITPVDDSQTPMGHPKFYDMLGNLGYHYLPNSVLPGCIERMVGVLKRDGSATVYTNEDVEIKIIGRASNEIKKGQEITEDDLADIKEVHINIAIPDDCGFFFIFHVGWMRCCFYDFGPVLPAEFVYERSYNMAITLGKCYRSVVFRKRLFHTDSEWDMMFENGWFPFFGLSGEKLSRLKSFWDEGLKIDEIVDEIANDLKKRLPKLLKSWEKYESFVDFHIEDVSQAVKYFMNDDHRGCGHILYSKIDGIMRSDYMTSKYRKIVLNEEEIENPNTDKLRKFATTISDVSGLLLPDKFKEYLKNVTYCRTTIKDRDVKPARHSVAHGYASNWSLETSVVAFLTFEQIMRCIMERQWELEENEDTE